MKYARRFKKLKSLTIIPSDTMMFGNIRVATPRHCFTRLHEIKLQKSLCWIQHHTPSLIAEIMCPRTGVKMDSEI